MRHWAAGLAAAVTIGVLSAAAAHGAELTLADRPLALTGWAEVREIIRANRSSPNELVLEQLWLRGRYSLSDNIAFEAALNTEHGGPATEQTKGGIYSYRSVFQSVSPSVQFEDAFVDLTFDALDLRLGMQKFAWGKLDRVQPTDVLNVQRYSDPFLLEEEERKIAVPAMQASYYAAAARLDSRRVAPDRDLDSAVLPLSLSARRRALVSPCSGAAEHVRRSAADAVHSARLSAQQRLAAELQYGQCGLCRASVGLQSRR